MSENTLTPDEAKNGFRLLFDGRTLNGWRNFREKTAPKHWAVEDGAIVLLKSSRPGEPGALGTGLVTDEMFGDFELRLEFLLAPGGNSGIFYRVSEAQDKPYLTGPEYQILDNAFHPDAQRGPERHCAACYFLYGPEGKTQITPGAWHEARVVVHQNAVEHWFDGRRVVSYELGSAEWMAKVAASKFKDAPGYGREKRGPILLQDHAHRVAFRTVRIKAGA